MLRTWWKIIRLAVLAIGVLLSFFAVIEVLRAYQTLHEFHPAAGFVFLGVLVCGTLWIVGYLVVTLASRPAVLIPPPIRDANSATNRELRRYAKYLTKYIGRLSGNGALSIEDRDKAKEAMGELALAIDTGDSKEALIIAVEKVEGQVIDPMLAKLDAEANKVIRDSVGIVMAGVAFSPYKAADLMIVLYRNLVMMITIVRIYNSRPRFREQLSIFLDTIKVVAVVNYLNMGKKLVEGLLSAVPFVGRYIDDAAQGFGAGFMTSVVGHVAMDRCRAFRGWKEENAKDSLRDRVGEFFTDVNDMFKKDILPAIMKRAKDVSKEKLEKVRTGIGSALDETGSRIGTFVKGPSRTAKEKSKPGPSRAGAMISGAVKGCSTAGRKAKNLGLGILRIVKSTGGKTVDYSKKKMRTIGKLIRRKKEQRQRNETFKTFDKDENHR